MTEPNAHPHVSSDEIAVVHNGIIENHEEQRARLKALGYVFESQTDTEVIAHLVHHYFKADAATSSRPRRRAANDLRGAYAIGVVALADAAADRRGAHGLPAGGRPRRRRELPRLGLLRADRARRGA